MIFQYSIWVNIPCDTPPPHGWSYKQIKRVTIVTCRPRWLRLHERPPRPLITDAATQRTDGGCCTLKSAGCDQWAAEVLHGDTQWDVSRALGLSSGSFLVCALPERTPCSSLWTLLLLLFIYFFILWGLKSEYRSRVWDEDAPNEVEHWGWKASPSFGTFKDARLCFMSAGLYLPNLFWIIIFIYYFFYPLFYYYYFL